MIAIIDIDADYDDGWRDQSTIVVQDYTWRDLMSMRRAGLDYDRDEDGRLLVIGVPSVDWGEHWTEAAERVLRRLGAEVVL